MSSFRLAGLSMLVGLCLPASLLAWGDESPRKVHFRRPAALVVMDDWLLAANQRSGTVSIIDVRQNAVIGELPVAPGLADLKRVAGSQSLLAVSESRHELILLRRRGETLEVVQRVRVSRHPVSIAVTVDGARCSVASLWSRRLTILDLERHDPDRTLRVAAAQSVDLPFAPRAQLPAPGGSQVIVADAFGGQLALVNLDEARIERTLTVPGHNIRGLAVTSDGRDVLIAQQLLNGSESTTRDHVFWGGVMLNVLRSVPLNELLAADQGSRLIGTILPLGYPSNAAGDPSGLIVTAEGRTVVSLGGVDEVAVRRDPIRPFRHHAVGRRPTALATAPGSDMVYAANTLDDSISVLTGPDLRVTATISLGPHPEVGPVERGEALFYDARLSLDGWFSCHSCHTDGHTNGLTSDNLGDAHFGSPKRVLSVRGAGETGPRGMERPRGDAFIADPQVHHGNDAGRRARRRESGRARSVPQNTCADSSAGRRPGNGSLSRDSSRTADLPGPRLYRLSHTSHVHVTRCLRRRPA